MLQVELDNIILATPVRQNKFKLDQQKMGMKKAYSLNPNPSPKQQADGPPKDEFQKVNDNDISSITSYYYTKYKIKKKRITSLNRELKKIEKEEETLEQTAKETAKPNSVNTSQASVTRQHQGSVVPKVGGAQGHELSATIKKSELLQKRQQIL